MVESYFLSFWIHAKRHNINLCFTFFAKNRMAHAVKSFRIQNKYLISYTKYAMAFDIPATKGDEDSSIMILT